MGCLRALAAADADMNPPTATGERPAHLAGAAALQVLSETGADLHLLDGPHRSPLAKAKMELKGTVICCQNVQELGQPIVLLHSLKLAPEQPPRLLESALTGKGTSTAAAAAPGDVQTAECHWGCGRRCGQRTSSGWQGRMAMITGA